MQIQNLESLTPEATVVKIISIDQKAGELLVSIGLQPGKKLDLLGMMDTIERKGEEIKNPGDPSSTYRMFRYNLELLFTTLREQFNIVNTTVLPLVRQLLSSF